VDWFSRDVWKSAADFLTTSQGIAASVVAIGGAIGAIWRWGAGFARWLASRFHGAKPVVPPTAAPAATLHFVSDDHRTYWSIGTRGEERAMMLWGRFTVTNTSDRHVCLLKFRLHGLNTENHMIFRTQQDREDCVIPRGYMAKVDIHCLLRQPIAESPGPFTADVIFTDNFGDEHPVPAVRFDFRGPQ
jgi:hypothetical protein